MFVPFKSEKEEFLERGYIDKIRKKNLSRKENI